MIRATILTAGFLLAAGTAMADDRSSFKDSRGYNNCVRVAESRAGQLRVDSRYAIDLRTGVRTYYLNGSSLPRSNGVLRPGPEPIRIACETTASGHRVLGLDLTTGQYVARVAAPAGLAAQ